jgi:hypothetical protein
MTITTFINILRQTNPIAFHFTSEELFEAVKGDEKLLKHLCDATMQTYCDIEHIKKIIE